MDASQPSTFALFPQSVPMIAVPKPHERRSLSLSKAASPSRSQHGESVIIKIVDDPAAYSHNCGYSNTSTRAQTPSPESEHIMAPVSPIDGRTPSPAPPVPPLPAFVSQMASQSPKKPTVLPPPPNRSLTSPSSPSTGGTKLSPISPVVPIRSMFPTYNPGVPLNRQSYYPQRPVNLPKPFQSRPEYNPRMMSPSPFEDPTGGPRSRPESIVNYPSSVVGLSQAPMSSHRELERLWEATNGMESDERVGSFDLEMTRINEATFRFGADAMTPFYTLQTYNTSEIAISRTPPQKRNAPIDILLLSIESTVRRKPPQDGLVTFIFPKLAAMLAIDQSNELAARHQLAPTHRDEMQTDAVQRAANQEASRLYWKENERRYELEHPAIGRNARDPDFAASPVSPQGGLARPVLHLTITSHNMASPRSMDSTPPIILVTNPNAAFTPVSAANSPHAGIRMSTLPQSDTSEPLASLDFGSMTLHIDAQQILALMPSLYAIDCIVSAMFAIAVADEATNPVMAGLDIWTPRARAPMSVFGGSVKSYTGSAYYATLAEREEAEEEAKIMKAVHQKDVKQKTGSVEKKKKGLLGKEKVKKQKKTKQIVMGEFDLEKLGHYQSGDRKGEELPAATVSILSFMVWTLQTIVWLLTMVVHVLTWILVNASRCITSEKF